MYKIKEYSDKDVSDKVNKNYDDYIISKFVNQRNLFK